MTLDDLKQPMDKDEEALLTAIDELILKLRRERQEYFNDVPLTERTGN